MAIRQLKDGRWTCYYRITGSDGKSRIKREYFGRGPDAQIAAEIRDLENSIEKYQEKIRIKKAKLRRIRGLLGIKIYPKNTKGRIRKSGLSD